MQTSINIPENIYMSIKLPEEEKEMRLLLELALSLYQNKMLSFGKARELSKMSKWDFDQILHERKIERHYDEVSFNEDLKYGSNI